jgi:hypothetical protein
MDNSIGNSQITCIDIELMRIGTQLAVESLISRNSTTTCAKIKNYAFLKIGKKIGYFFCIVTPS